jgi:hypothetical protein
MWFDIKMFVDVFLKLKLEHFIHDVFLITHIITFPTSSLITLSTKTKTSNMYMMPKFNANIKFKLSLRWYKHVNIKKKYNH